MYDITIIGGGPAGLTAAIYALRANKSVVVFEKDGFGGQMNSSPVIENFPGFAKISGAELADKMFDHACGLGAEIEIDRISSIKPCGDTITVTTEGGREFTSKAVIVATGAKHRVLGVPGEETFTGNGVYYCAVCDGAFYKDRSVAVIGGGNSALQEALMLSDICKKVTVVQNLSYLTGEGRLIETVQKRENIEVLTNTIVSKFIGDSAFSGAELLSGGKTHSLKADAAFIAVGLVPDNEFAIGAADLDNYGYIKSDDGCTTGTDGVFVAGDCRTKSIRQIATAVADGAVAALSACRYIDGLDG